VTGLKPGPREKIRSGPIKGGCGGGGGRGEGVHPGHTGEQEVLKSLVGSESILARHNWGKGRAMRGGGGGPLNHDQELTATLRRLGRKGGWLDQRRSREENHDAVTKDTIGQKQRGFAGK